MPAMPEPFWAQYPYLRKCSWPSLVLRVVYAREHEIGDLTVELVVYMHLFVAFMAHARKILCSILASESYWNDMMALFGQFSVTSDASWLFSQDNPSLVSISQCNLSWICN